MCNIDPVRGNWLGLFFEDGQPGMRTTDFGTEFAVGMNAMTTWIRTLIREWDGAGRRSGEAADEKVLELQEDSAPEALHPYVRRL